MYDGDHYWVMALSEASNPRVGPGAVVVIFVGWWEMKSNFCFVGPSLGRYQVY